MLLGLGNRADLHHGTMKQESMTIAVVHGVPDLLSFVVSKIKQLGLLDLPAPAREPPDLRWGRSGGRLHPTGCGRRE